MNIITVYPIIRGAFKEELTYWSSHTFDVGTIIEVPLRNRTIPALVGTVVPASHAKSNIKQASFVTRKIEKTKELHVVKPECIKACIKMSEQYAVALGSVLKSCIPDTILKETIESKITLEKIHAVKSDTESTVASDILVFQTNTEDRLGTYKSIVREEFARKRSVLIVAPTVISALELHTNLQKGIEEYVLVLHGSLSKKKQIDTWKKALETDHPVLIITTPLFASIPRTDVQTIILERESSRAYSAIRTPYIDFRDYIETYAKLQSARLILGDTLLRVETLYRKETGEISDFFPVSYRVEKEAEIIIVDTSKKTLTKEQIKEGLKNKPFQIFSEELHSMIEYTGKKSLPMFIFTARRGLSPQTVCGDCGHTVECQVCHAPIVLHQKKTAPTGSHTGAHTGAHAGAHADTTISPTRSENEYSMDINPNRFFLCHHCGTERGAVEACTICGSWKLITLGIGIETVADEIKKHFPKREVFRLDKDVVKTDKQAQDVIQEFTQSKDGILLGTESSLAFLPPIEYSAIASLDSLFSIPDFKINERIAHTILRIIEKTSKYVLIQTRDSKNSVLKHIESGNLLGLYREEISVRKMLQYPPFITHIKISVEDTRASATIKMKKLQQLLEECQKNSSDRSNSITNANSTTALFDTMVFPAFAPGSKGKSTLHLLLSIPKDAWPNEHLRSLLQSLPPEYAVRVNPESLL